jgi:hypothetical protein
MYYFALLFIVLLILTGCTAAAAWWLTSVKYWSVDPAFLGALIGAAGTIFAATIAYVAVQKQIDLAKQQAEDGVRAQQKFEKQQAETYLIGLRSGKAQINESLQAFLEIPDQDPDRYRDTLLALFRAGNLRMNISANMPGDFPSRAQDFVQRMNALRYQVEVLFNQNPDPSVRVQNRDWIAVNGYVRDAILQGRRFVVEIDAEIAKRETAH